jgi:60 kDa SS-A/Ro ribonucleoprotein
MSFNTWCIKALFILRRFRMAKINVPLKRSTSAGVTAEGAPAKKTNALQRLKRLVMSCLLWEDEFYVDGEDIGQQIVKAVKDVKPEEAMNVAIEARTAGNLRHAPLLIASAMEVSPKHHEFVSRTLQGIIQRVDELTEFLAVLTKVSGKPAKKMSFQVKKGLGNAFKKFNEYALAKYNRDGAFKLRDVLFLTHPKPKDKDQDKLWKKLIGGFCSSCWKPIDVSDKAKKEGIKPCKCANKEEAKLAIPDTWEVELSAGKDKGTTFTRLLKEEKLGALALLRNLRNMQQAGVEDKLIRTAIKGMDGRRVLPFRYIAAARYAPNLEDVLEEAMFKSISALPKLKGSTIVLVDVSGSMDAVMSAKSDMHRVDAACGLAMICREICEEAKIFSFSNQTIQIAPRHGFALKEAILKSQGHGGTDLGLAVREANRIGFDRLIVITDEQSQTAVGNPKDAVGYMINVASNRNGVGYGGNWVHIDGFSESIISYISAFETIED